MPKFMITYEEALSIVLQHTIDVETALTPLENAPGKVLLEDLVADRDFPPFNRATMDGIAIAYDAYAKGRRSFLIEKTAPAGTSQSKLENPENCIEIMTGAVLPEGADTIIRYEKLEVNDGNAKIMGGDITKGKNVHYQGEDRKKGEVIVKKGVTLSPAEIGVAATIGKTHVKVVQFPKAAIISSGDELVEVRDTPLPHQIRKSNVYQLFSLLKNWGIASDMYHLNDDKVEIEETLRQVFAQNKLVVLSGGVSRGKLDFIPEVLEKLGAKKLFHKVKQRPGKPFWFGTGPDGSVIFAFPGNPVSSFMCANAYLHPWIYACMKLPLPSLPKAVLTEDFHFPKDLTYFLSVKILYGEDGKLLARPQKGQGSGDLANLVEADGFMVLPRGREGFSKGAVFPVIYYR